MNAFRSRYRTLPLGIDLGATRIRVALVQRCVDGSTELIAVATRKYAENPSAALLDAVGELPTRERRCVFGMTQPHAILQRVRFPAMRHDERERAARFEAARFVAYSLDDAIVRVTRLGRDNDTVIGVARRDRVASLVAIAHSVRLKVVAIDHSALALHRALPDIEAVLDIGEHDSRLHVFTDRLPIERRFDAGGAAFTSAIVHALGTDEISAQKRKHTHGMAGCGQAEFDYLLTAIANALVQLRADGSCDVRAIALVGNGSRLPELPALIERVTGVRVRCATFGSSVSKTVPPDVLRAAAPDWSLAYGLALWAAA